MSKVNNFDVLKQMSAENLDIRMSPSTNIVNMNKTKAGTQVTIGAEGDVLNPIMRGDLGVCLMMWNTKQFNELKARMEAESEAVDDPR